MGKLHEKLFGVEEKGWPSFPNTRKQLLIGGLACLAIWPGIGLVLLMADQIGSGQRAFILLNPMSLIALLGIYLIGQSVFSRKERPKYTKKTAERKR